MSCGVTVFLKSVANTDDIVAPRTVPTIDLLSEHVLIDDLTSYGEV